VKRFLFVGLIAAAWAMAQAPVQKVYILPMRGGLDQFLAARLTEAKVISVVVDPKLADSILTDRVGKALEKSLEELYATPEVKQAKKEEEERSGFAPGVFMGGNVKGNVFLVDLKSRQVLWSAYEKPKNSTPDQLNRVAGQIVQRMQKDWGLIQK